MKIICKKGFYKFYPQTILEVSRFQRKTGFELKKCQDFYTFPELSIFPNWTFKNHPIQGTLIGKVNYSDNPEDVFSKNGFTFNLKTNSIVDVGSFMTYIQYNVGNFIVASKLPQAYGLDKDNDVVTGFDGFLNLDIMKYNIERFDYEGI